MVLIAKTAKERPISFGQIAYPPFRIIWWLTWFGSRIEAPI
jgi:hypothetical protein